MSDTISSLATRLIGDLYRRIDELEFQLRESEGRAWSLYRDLAEAKNAPNTPRNASTPTNTEPATSDAIIYGGLEIRGARDRD